MGADGADDDGGDTWMDHGGTRSKSVCSAPSGRGHNNTYSNEWSPEKREHASISGFVLQRVKCKTVKCKTRNGEWTGLWNGTWNG